MGNVVLIDESYRPLDKVTGRYAFGHVILDEERAVEFQDWLIKNVENDTLRFDLSRKLHFSELSPAQRDRLVEQVSKLPLTFKVYITYITRMADSKNVKLHLLKESLVHHERNKPGSNYIVEGSSEYAGIDSQLPDLSVNSVDFTDNKALLLPDILLGVFCGFLDIRDPAQSTDIIKWHTLIYNQIRLEVVNYAPKKKLYLTRQKKIV